MKASPRLLRFVRGVRFRLMLWSVLILTVVLLALSAFVYTRQLGDLKSYTVNRLSQKVRQLEAYSRLEELFTSELIRPLFPESFPGGISLVQEDEVLVLVGSQSQIIQKMGTIVESDINRVILMADAVLNNDRPGSSSIDTRFTTAEGTEVNYIFLVTPIQYRRKTVGFFLLGRPLDPSGQMSRLALTLGLASVAVLLVAILGSYWFAGRVLRPIQIITRAAHQISETDLNRRLNLNTGDELGELALTFDQMLARLQAAFERQRQFTADASHELRTPLTIVNLEASRVLASPRKAEEYRHALQVILKENDHMTRLVQDLLTLARMDAGQVALDLTTIDLGELALEAVERLAPVGAQRGVTLIAGELAETPARGDRATLLQMLTNLVENGIKYSAGTEKWVRIETGVENGRPWVMVEDNGLGIPADKLSLIFDRFFQVDEARTNAAENGEGPAGSGLGLSIVKWVVDSHGGEIKVHSELGQGTTFQVFLQPET